MKQMIETCLSKPTCARLVHLLSTHPTTVMSCTDLSAWIQAPAQETEVAIQMLFDLGLLRRVAACGDCFYGVADDPRARDLIRQFRAWCKGHRDQWESLRSVVQPG